MKIGMRRPSLKKSFSARTTGRVKREIKRAIIPGYGKKGMGLLHPKKAIYNQVYRRTTFSIFDLAKSAKSGSSNSGCCMTLLFWMIIITFCAIVLQETTNFPSKFLHTIITKDILYNLCSIINNLLNEHRLQYICPLYKLHHDSIMSMLYYTLIFT